MQLIDSIRLIRVADVTEIVIELVVALRQAGSSGGRAEISHID